MDYEIIQINKDTWRIEEGGVRFFLLAGKERALLIDSGMMVHNAREIAESLTKLPLSLLNTHVDMDHIGSNAHLEEWTDTFDEIWPSHADFPVKPELIEKLRDGAERILAGEVTGRSAAFHGQKITAYDLGFTTFLCDK